MSEEMTPIVEPSADELLAKELVERARSEGAQLVGSGGLLTDLTKTVLEAAVEVEMEDHLGYPKHAPEGRDNGMGLLGFTAASKYMVTALVLLAAVTIDALSRRGRVAAA